MKYRWMILFALTLLVSGCQSRTGAQAVVDGRFDVGGFKLYLHCVDQRPQPTTSPTVLLEHGIGRRATSEMWVEVQQHVAPMARVCRYDRAGVGRSDPPLHLHRTRADLVAEQHQLLQAAGIMGPYILVGHSFGGYPVRLYAHQYPAEVVGMVLADTAHEDMIGEIPLAPEVLDAHAIGNQVRAAGGLGALPLVVITRGRDRSDRWDAFQQRLMTLSTNNQQLIAETSDHQIPVKQPDVIVSAIRNVLHAVDHQTPLTK